MSTSGMERVREESGLTSGFSGWRADSGEKHILVADDEPKHLNWIQSLLDEKGYHTAAAADGSQACELLTSKPFNALITDLKMPGKSGIEVVQHMRRVQPHCLGIVLTGFGSIEDSVEAMRAGAYDFMPKPVQPQKMLEVIEEGFRLQGLRNGQNLEDLQDEFIVGSSPKMIRARELMEKVAATDSTVLILGESGTGKELVAKTLHRLSTRRSKPFVVVHCGAIPETLLESELFGHEKGAFTGAFRARTGRFELAHGGTIFLDEVGDIPTHLQLKLLRVLQDRKFERVGGSKTISADFRVVAATNKDLSNEVAEGRFRMDLYYRLNVIPLRLPALRERKQDILLLCQYFVDLFNGSRKGAVEGFSDEASQLLLGYPWPGNVRELKNLMERLVVLTEGGIITPEDLPDGFHTIRMAESVTAPTIPDEGVCLNTLLEAFENRLLLQALDKADGVKNRAAKLLNIKRTTLVEKMKKKQLDVRATRPDGPTVFQ
jgi:two-component system response regulator AtoC